MCGMLKGRKAIVTGASKGIGRRIATKFSEEGAIVGVNYHKSDYEAKEVLSHVKEWTDGMLLQGDVSREDDCNDIIDCFIDNYDSIDILVNNAGIYLRKDIEEAKIDDYDRTMAVNVRGPYILSKVCFPHLKESDAGRIINLTSQLAFKGSTHGTAYVTSKAALVGLTRALALELGPHGITVNGIAPGTIDTDIIGDYSEEKRKLRAEKIPVKRIGKPEDIADTAIFLASDMGSYVNGDILGVNGGSALH